MRPRLPMTLGGLALAAAIVGPASAADNVKIGFITKFPVPFLKTPELVVKYIPRASHKQSPPPPPAPAGVRFWWKPSWPGTG